MKPEIYESKYSRSAEFTRRVTVYQHVTVSNDPVWDVAGVNWASIGTVTPQEAEDFAALIVEAAKLAKHWNLNAGKAVADG